MPIITPVHAPADSQGGPAATPRALLTRALILLNDAANGVTDAAKLAGRAGHAEREKSLHVIARSIVHEMSGIGNARDNAAG
jgi:hypothetical protein